MHRLLERQMKKALPEGRLEGLDDFLAAVDAAYRAADEDRALLERSMEMTSEELQAKNRALRQHIDDLTAVQARLAASEDAYRRLIMTASEGIWTLDAQGRIDFVNDTLCTALGHARQDFLGRRPLDFVHPGQVQGGDVLAERFESTGDRFEFPMRRRDGGVSWMLVSTSPIKGAAGERAGALAMFSDITARKQAEDALRQAYETLRRADSARQQFINAAAHELGTPLTPIRLQVHALKRQAAGEMANSILVLERNVDRIIMLVNDLLDSAKLQTKRLALTPQTVDLAQLLQATGASFGEVATQAGIQLVVDAKGVIPAQADARRLQQVLDNLVVNAAKFTPAGGTITLKCGTDGDLGWFEVRDTGIGIDPEDAGRLFQPFSQLEDEVPSGTPGTGLGLYVSRGLMEAMGGTLTVQSHGKGRGATFRGVLPLEPQARPNPEASGPSTA